MQEKLFQFNLEIHFKKIENKFEANLKQIYSLG